MSSRDWISLNSIPFAFDSMAQMRSRIGAWMRGLNEASGNVATFALRPEPLGDVQRRREEAEAADDEEPNR